MGKTCVKCGYVRRSSDTAPDYECPRCGVIYAKAEEALANGTLFRSGPKVSEATREPSGVVDSILVDAEGDLRGESTAAGVPMAQPKKEATKTDSKTLVRVSGSVLAVIGVITVLNGMGFNEMGQFKMGLFSIGVLIFFVGLTINPPFESLGIKAWAESQAKLKSKRKLNLVEQLAEQPPDFDATQQVLGVEFIVAASDTSGDDAKSGMSMISAPVSGLAIDEERHKLCLISISHGTEVHRRVVSYKDVISVELFLDGASVSKTDQSSQAGGALVGGLMLGGLGMVVGALSGQAKTETIQKVDRIDLRLTLNDTRSPLHEVSFLNPKQVGAKGDKDKDKAMQLARQWNGIISAAIRQAADENKVPHLAGHQVSPRPDPAPPTVANGSVMSVADELKKLADLHSAGILTADEFQQQKMKVLGASH